MAGGAVYFPREAAPHLSRVPACRGNVGILLTREVDRIYAAGLSDGE